MIVLLHLETHSHYEFYQNSKKLFKKEHEEKFDFLLQDHHIA
jgi:hypothetical protein